jgi:serine/threonine protein kinase
MPVDEAREYNGEIWGTPYYVAPEKLESRGEDVRSDIYSLAASLFHAMAGRAPFEADTVSLVAWKHLKASKVSLKTFAPHVHNETVRVINKALERDPALRYQNYDEFITALESALKTCREVPIEEEQKVLDLTGQQVEQRVGMYVLIGLIVFSVLLALTWIVFSSAMQERVDPLEEMLREVEAEATSQPSPTPRGTP